MEPYRLLQSRPRTVEVGQPCGNGGHRKTLGEHLQATGTAFRYHGDFGCVVCASPRHVMLLLADLWPGADASD
ncbi:hypothetical protein ACFQ8S_36485 [Streptomyces virginiae]|uniref:hypothetical protein n=1 Tax=Streptomyces virginiae TaxID=1961 RepID=UPI003695EA5E